MKVQWKIRSIASFLPAMMYNSDVFVTGILAEVPYFIEERERSLSATDQGQSCECDVIPMHENYSVAPTLYDTYSGIVSEALFLASAVFTLQFAFTFVIS